MPALLENLIIATLALRPDAGGCIEGSTCFVQATGIRYQVRGGTWRQLSDDGQSGGGGGAGVDTSITSYALLAAVVTADVVPGEVGSVKQWVHSTLGFKCSQLRASTAATDTGSGVQRPDDYHADTNAKAWFDV